MMYPEAILTLSEEIDSFVELQNVDDDVLEIAVVTKLLNNVETVESVDVVLSKFGIDFIESFIEIFLNDGLLDTDMPAEGNKNLEKRKGVKYILDHLKAIVLEAKGEEQW